MGGITTASFIEPKGFVAEMLRGYKASLLAEIAASNEAKYLVDLNIIYLFNSILNLCRGLSSLNLSITYIIIVPWIFSGIGIVA